MFEQDIQKAIEIASEWKKPTENVVDCVRTEYIHLVSNALIQIQEENNNLRKVIIDIRQNIKEGWDALAELKTGLVQLEKQFGISISKDVPQPH